MGICVSFQFILLWFYLGVHAQVFCVLPQSLGVCMYISPVVSGAHSFLEGIHYCWLLQSFHFLFPFHFILFHPFISSISFIFYKNIPLSIEWFKVSDSPECCLVTDLCVKCHLLKDEASWMRTKQGTNRYKTFRVILLFIYLVEL